MSGEGGDVPGFWVQHQLVISSIEIEFAKHFCTIEVMYYFIKGRHEVSFSGYCFVSFPHVHAQPYSTRLFGLGHQDHRGYPGGGSISGFSDILLQQGLFFFLHISPTRYKYFLLHPDCTLSVMSLFI